MKLTTTTRSWRFLTLGCILLVILLPSAGRAQLIDVDFNANSTPGYTQSGAAVLGNAGDLWNGIVWSASQSSNFASLFDSMGITSGISLTFSAPAAFNAASYPQAGLPNGFYGTPYSNLMNDYLVAYPNQPGQFTLSGLQPTQDYQLLVYTDSAADGTGRQTNVTVSGLTVTQLTNAPLNPMFNQFVQGSNYLAFNVKPTQAGLLTVDFSAAVGEGDITGFQLVAVPEPSTLALMLVGGLGVVYLTVRRHLFSARRVSHQG
jgi:PEP-CTERM motif